MFRSGTGSGSNDRGGTYDPVFVSPASNGVPPSLPLFTWVRWSDGMEDEEQNTLKANKNAEDILSWDANTCRETAGAN